MADNDTIAVDAPQQQPTISVANPTAITTNLSPDAVEYRSQNAAFGVQTGLTQKQISYLIDNGQENAVREVAANKVNATRTQMAKQLVDEQGDTLANGTLQAMLKYQDPNSVFEEHYAKAYMNHLNWPSDPAQPTKDSWAYWSQLGLKDAWDWAKNAGSVSMAQDHYLLTKIQNDNANWKDTVNSSVADIFTFGGYSEYQLRQNTAGTGFLDGLGLGSNLKAQSQALADISDFDRWRAEVDRIWDNLPPAYRAQWAQDMLFKSQGSVAFDNLMTGLNAFIPAKIATNVGRNVLNPVARELAFNTARIPTNYTVAVANARSRFENVARAVADMAEPRPTHVPPEVAAPAQAGNIPESAVNIVAIDNINELNPNNNPLTPLRNMLTANYDADGTLAASAPGRLGREAANRLKEMVDSYGQEFVDTVFNHLLQRVDRTPTASEASVLRRLQLGLADLHRGPDNSVLNVSRDIWLPGFNARMFNLALGTPDGTLFSNVEEAKAIARKIGLVVKGDYAVSQEERVNLIRKENAIQGFRMQASLAKTPEGAARANKLADDIQKELDKVPRHTTGVTIEERLAPAETFGQTIERLEAESGGPVTAIPKEPKAPQGTTYLGKNSDGDRVYEHNDGRRVVVKDKSGFKITEGTPVTGGRDKIYEPVAAQPKTRLQLLAEQGPPEPIIKQQGNGFYILHTVFLPEQANFVRDGILTSDLGGLTKEQFREKLKLGAVSTGIPNDWAGGWVNAVTNMLGISAPSEVMSISENLNRQIAVHGPSVLLALMQKGLEPFKELNKGGPLIAKKNWGDFNRMIRYLQNDFNPETHTPGRWFDTMAEVDDFYQRVFNRQVTEPEVRAYFAFKALMLDDLNFRNLSVLTKKLSMGARQHAIRYTDADGITKRSTPFFEGVRLDNIPENGRVMYVGVGKTRVGLIGRVLQNNPELENDIKEGRAQLIHIMDPKTKPLKDIDGRTVDYVISYNTEEKPLGLQHVNRLGGGHMVPKWDYFAKQADIDVFKHDDGVSRYMNPDKTLLSFRTKAQAEEAIEYLEPVRQVLARYVEAHPKDLVKDIERWENEGGAVGNDYLGEAAQLAQRTGIPFQKLLDLWVRPNAPFDVHEPIRVVPKGGSINQLGGEVARDLRLRHPDLIDNTKTNTLLSQVMAEFTQERDAEGLYTMRWKGTESNPYFAYEHAELVDPITALERGYSRIVESMYMWDMKQYSMEHWLEQAKDYLNIADITELRLNPLKFFYGDRNNIYKKDIPEKVYQQLENNRLAAQQFIGLQSKYDIGLKQIGQALADTIYGSGRVEIKALHEIPSIRKVGQLMKNFAFYLAMSGPTAYWTQMASLGNIAAIAGPKNAGKATAAMTMYGLWRKMSGSPEMLEQLDRQMAQYMNWQPGRFSEAVRLLEGTGFGSLEAEHSFRPGEASLGLQSMTGDENPIMLGVKTAWRGGKALLDMSTLPFKLGSATTRISGFFVAFLEHLENAPGGVVDRQLQAAILNRASLLDANMSRAHNMYWQNRFPIPFQFKSYDIRMGQMMWGKNLSVEEKERLFAWSSMMYGLRGGYAAVFGIPITNTVLNYYYDNGYVPGEDTAKDIVVNGLPSWMFAQIRGFTDANGHKTWIDPSNWGTRGVETIEDFFDRDGTTAKIIAGVTGNIFGNLWESTWGLRQWMSNTDYRITSDDIIAVANNLKIFNDIRTAYLGFKFGQLLTKNETYVTDMDRTETFFKTFFGLSPIAAADTFRTQRQLGDIEKDIRAAQSHYTNEVARAMRDASPEGGENVQGFYTHMHNAEIIKQGLIPSTKWKETENAADRATLSLQSRIDKKKWIDLRANLEQYYKLQDKK